MNNQQKMALVRAIFNLIFQGKQTMTNDQWPHAPKPVGFEQAITVWIPRGFVKGSCRGIDLEVNVGGRILSLRCLEQNPNKLDAKGNLKQTAIRARNGEQIMWVIDRKQQTGGFLGSMQNGQWIPSQDRAYQTVNPRNTQTVEASRAGFSTDAVPDVPAGMGIPEYVIMEHGHTDSTEYLVAQGALNNTESVVRGPYDDDPMDNFDPSIYDDEDIYEPEAYEPY